MLPVRIGRQCLKMKLDNKVMLKLACFPKFELKFSRPLYSRYGTLYYVLLGGRDVHVCSTKYMGIHKLEAHLQKFI